MRSLNATYARLVYGRRLMTHYNFSKDAGWECEKSAAAVAGAAAASAAVRGAACSDNSTWAADVQYNNGQMDSRVDGR